jgi:hypothetical protein
MEINLKEGKKNKETKGKERRKSVLLQTVKERDMK